MRQVYRFTLLHVDIKVFLHHLWKIVLMPYWIVFTPLLKSNDHKYMYLFLGSQLYSVRIPVYHYVSNNVLVTVFCSISGSEEMNAPTMLFFKIILTMLCNLNSI